MAAEGESMGSSRIAVLLVALALASSVPTPARAAERVVVEFIDPARFTDVRERCSEGTPAALDELARFLRVEGARLLPDGWTLAVAITQLDRAGALEAWRGPQFCDLRQMRDVYPPRIDLRFTLTDAQGRRREGQRELRDQNYLSRPVAAKPDPLRFEKAQLLDWLRTEIGQHRPS